MTDQDSQYGIKWLQLIRLQKEQKNDRDHIRKLSNKRDNRWRYDTVLNDIVKRRKLLKQLNQWFYHFYHGK